MGRVRQTLLRYPVSVIATAIGLPFVAILTFSLLAKPPDDRFFGAGSVRSGFTLESSASGLPYSRHLGRFGQQNLSPLRALHYGFDWIRVNDRVYKSTFPAQGMLWRPEFIAANDIVVREKFSGRFGARWINSLTTEVFDNADYRLVARRTHWSSDDEPHPENSPGTSTEFVAAALGLDAPIEHKLSRVPVRVNGSVAPDQTRPAQVHFNRERAILYGCDQNVTAIDSHVTYGIRGRGWEYTNDYAIAAVYCQNKDVFVYYDPGLSGGRVVLEWLKSNGVFIGHFDFFLGPGNNERRRTPSWVKEFSFDEQVITLQIASGRTSDSPIVVASIEIDTTGADYSQVLTNGDVERPNR